MVKNLDDVELKIKEVVKNKIIEKYNFNSKNWLRPPAIPDGVLTNSYKMWNENNQRHKKTFLYLLDSKSIIEKGDNWSTCF